MSCVEKELRAAAYPEFGNTGGNGQMQHAPPDTSQVSDLQVVLLLAEAHLTEGQTRCKCQGLGPRQSSK